MEMANFVNLAWHGNGDLFDIFWNDIFGTSLLKTLSHDQLHRAACSVYLPSHVTTTTSPTALRHGGTISCHSTQTTVPARRDNHSRNNTHYFSQSSKNYNYPTRLHFLAWPDSIDLQRPHQRWSLPIVRIDASHTVPQLVPRPVQHTPRYFPTPSFTDVAQQRNQHRHDRPLGQFTSTYGLAPRAQTQRTRPAVPIESHTNGRGRPKRHPVFLFPDADHVVDGVVQL